MEPIQPMKVFISYAYGDEALLEELKKQLFTLQRENLITKQIRRRRRCYVD
jgi:hypothetical protein